MTPGAITRMSAPAYRAAASSACGDCAPRPWPRACGVASVGIINATAREDTQMWRMSILSMLAQFSLENHFKRDLHAPRRVALRRHFAERGRAQSGIRPTPAHAVEHVESFEPEI